MYRHFDHQCRQTRTGIQHIVPILFLCYLQEENLGLQLVQFPLPRPNLTGKPKAVD